MLARIVVIVVALLASVPAYAHAHKYPMAASDYRKRVDQRFTRYKERLEQRMTEHKLDAAKRTDARKRLDALVTELLKLVDEVAKDDTVTKAEAGRVKQRGKQLRAALYRDLGFAHAKGE